jgi:hypothetical protein
MMRREHHRSDDGVQSGGVTPSGGDGDAHESLPTSHLLNGREDLAGVGVSPQSFLGKHELVIDGHFEYATGGLDQPDFGLWVCLLQLSRQPGGSGLIVSDDAVLNGYVHDRHRFAGVTAGRRES